MSSVVQRSLLLIAVTASATLLFARLLTLEPGTEATVSRFAVRAPLDATVTPRIETAAVRLEPRPRAARAQATRVEAAPVASVGGERAAVLRGRGLGGEALSIAGALVDRDGAPVEGDVVVRVPSDGGLRVLEAASGPDGRFQLDGVPPGEGGVGPRCARVELRATSRDGQLVGELPELAVAPGGAPVRVVLRRQHQLVVRVRDVDGRPLSAHGQARLVDGSAGAGRSLGARWRSELVWSATEDACVEVTVEANGRAPRRLLVRLPADPIEVRLQRGAAVVQGDVVGPDGAPVSSTLRVEWSRPPAPITSVARGEVRELEPVAGCQFGATDLQGRFRLEGLPAGVTFRVGASSPDFERGTREGVRAGEHVRVVLAPRGVERAARVRFRAVAAEGRGALQGRVTLRASWPSGEEGATVVSSMSEGQEVSFREYAGPLRVQLEAPLRVPSRSFDVQVAPGAPVDLGDVPLLLGGAVQLTVEGWPALPVTELRARWRDPDGRERVATRRGPGATWTIDGVAPGAVALEVEAVVVDGEPIRRPLTVHVRAGETTSATVHLGGE